MTVSPSASSDDGSGGRPAPGLRASDRERADAVAQLSDATGDGRLTLAEFDERSSRAYAATTRDELAAITADLPTPPASAAVGQSGGKVQHVPIGAIKRHGHWRVEQDMTISAGLGAIKLDLANATIAAPEVSLHVRATIGSVKVWIPRGVRVDVTGTTMVGTRLTQDDADGQGPLVHLRIDTKLGSVKVYRV